MDQHSARPGGPAAPPPAPGGEAATGVYRPSAPPPRAAPAALIRRLRTVQRPRARLTGLGTGVLVTVVTVLAGTVDAMLFDGPGVFFGVVFVAVCATAAVYVRPYDLVAAPVSAPIAFALGIGLTADSGDGGLVGRLLGLFTGLALMTGWLYTGTVLAALIVGIRALRLPSQRRRSRRCSATRRGRSAR
ncbi:DUF6542 domain-containing protein [Actinacidiphila paucisporea]|uniref:DUF6542 domain-containing protein n=1 Tax=Actinacidiphila paucisporea TaxID=310782 RepID=A0A1M6UKP4_9ACTN|nr:DUF6542 domain-containing protein [Actinacidiphila paucisporea]SHK69814.1 hypothetical protein SAMN05216499_101402 [Actinacidiphila paucisporea]